MNAEAILIKIMEKLDQLLVRAEQTQLAMDELRTGMASLERRVDDVISQMEALRVEREAEDDLSPNRVLQ